MSHKTLIEHFKRNHHRFHLFFVLIIATAITFGFYQLTLIGSQLTKAQTATFYVALNGDDSRSCATANNISTPKKTLNNTVACLTPGATLLVRGGTYDEALVNKIPSGTSWTNLVRVKAYPGETVWMRPSNAPTAMRFGGDTWEGAVSPQYIEVDGINMDGTLSGGGSMNFDCRNGSNIHHLRFKNLESIVAHTGYSGIMVCANDMEFINMKVHGGGTQQGCGLPCSTYGFYVPGSRNLFDNVEIYDVSALAYHFYSGSPPYPSDNIVRNSRIHDIVRSGDWRGGGILLSRNTHVYNNIIYNIDIPADTPDQGNAAIIFGGSGATGNKVYNNTIINNKLIGIKISSYGGDPSNNEVRNNLVFGNTNTLGHIRNEAAATANNTISNNLCDTTSTTCQFGGNPNLSSDFHLTPGSSLAIDKGTPISLFNYDFEGTTRPQGSAWDIGADEFGAGNTVPPPGPVPPPTYSQGAYTQPPPPAPIPPPPSSTVCSITNVTWSATSYTVGTTATANITVNDSTACQNKTLTIYIYEEDPFSFDDILVGPATLTFNSSTNTTTYTHLFTTQDYTNGGNESGNESIYFTVQLQGQTTYSRSNQINFYSTSTQPPPAPLPPPTYNQATYQGSYTQPPPPTYNQATYQGSYSNPPPPPTYSQATYQGSYSPPPGSPPPPGPQAYIPPGVDLTIPTLFTWAQSIGGFLMILAGILAAISIIGSGIVYLTSASNIQRVASAKSFFKVAIIGSLIIFSAGLIINTVRTLSQDPLQWFR
jgi:hypothetical protein